MIRTLWTPVLLLMLAMIALAACGADAPTAAAPLAPTPEPTASPVPPAPTGMQTYVIVPEQSKASYVAAEEFFAGALAELGIGAGAVETVGSTRAVEGQLQLDLAGPDHLGENHFTVRLDTLESDQVMRDAWLKRNGPKFNDFPEATFVATAIAGAPATYTAGAEATFQLIGDLTIRNITRPATFDVTAVHSGKTITGVATAQIRLTDYEIEPPNFANTLEVQDEMGLRLEFTAVAS